MGPSALTFAEAELLLDLVHDVRQHVRRLVPASGTQIVNLKRPEILSHFEERAIASDEKCEARAFEERALASDENASPLILRSFTPNFSCWSRKLVVLRELHVLERLRGDLQQALRVRDLLRQLQDGVHAHQTWVAVR